MKVVGVITEYNPFHYGHQYQLDQLRQETKADVLLVLMSGNVVQRGEFAIVDKWSRAKAALQTGADLVIELPLLASMQSADYFSKIGVQLLAGLKVDTFGFGTEEASLKDLEYIATMQNNHEATIDIHLKKYLNRGLSYAAAYQKAFDHVVGKLKIDTSLPNHLLSLQYLKTNQQLAKPMEPVVIKRVNTYQQHRVTSASQIRKNYWQNKNVEKLAMPTAIHQPFLDEQTVKWDDYFELLKYRLMTHTPASLHEIVGVREGVEHLILNEFKSVQSFVDLTDALTSKRWARSSIQRILLSILLDIKVGEWQKYKERMQERPLLRILGFNDSGRNYLNTYRKALDVDLFSNFSQSEMSRYHLMLRGDQVYELNPIRSITDQNIATYPIYFKF